MGCFVCADAVNPNSVRINHAELHQLTTVPGIGDVFAKAIIEARVAGGPFRHWQDVVNRVHLPPGKKLQTASSVYFNFK